MIEQPAGTAWLGYGSELAFEELVAMMVLMGENAAEGAG